LGPPPFCGCTDSATTNGGGGAGDAWCEQAVNGNSAAQVSAAAETRKRGRRAVCVKTKGITLAPGGDIPDSI
jgi:hypothetical protein